MPDLTMCKDEVCPRNKQCYRYIAKPSPIQSYFAKSPREPGVVSCMYFLDSKHRIGGGGSNA